MFFQTKAPKFETKAPKFEKFQVSKEGIAYNCGFHLQSLNILHQEISSI